MSEGRNSTTRRGRRPGESGTRSAILTAARRLFAEQGYDSASIRDIASAAGVDPALIHHYFGNKDSLFTAAMRLPNLPELLGGALAANPSAAAEGRLGEVLVRTVIRIWEDKSLQRTATGLLRSALTHDRASGMLRDFVRRAILGRVADRIDAPDRELRVSLVASQVIGLLMTRYILRVEPIASLNDEQLVQAVAPTLQRYISGDLCSPPTK
jgi:AcrR family transcriptional regulator